MKIWKIIAGIISILAFALVTLESFCMGIENFLNQTKESTGTIGLRVALLLLLGGIVSVAICKSNGKFGNTLLIIIFGAAAIIGYTGAGNFDELYFWATWSAINAGLALVAFFVGNKIEEEDSAPAPVVEDKEQEEKL